ncbi:MAG: DNA mismatch endonuclease Vsr [Candidatus Sulfotelmatobacter sp.]
MDTISPVRRSENMRRIKSKGMKPELAVRTMVHRMGYRYRLHSRDLPGKPDLVFRTRKKVIEVRGCFWHQHLGCREAHIPKSSTSYWLPKLARNKQRDKANCKRLRALGWRVLVVWECEVDDAKHLSATLRKFLGR